MQQERLPIAWQLRGAQANAVHHVLCSRPLQEPLLSELKTTARIVQPAILDITGHTTAVTQPTSWVQLQLHSLDSKISGEEISSKIFGNLFPEIMTNKPGTWIPTHVYLCSASRRWSVLCLSFSFRLKSPFIAGAYTQQAVTWACWWAEQIALLEAFPPAQICVGFCILFDFSLSLTKHMFPSWRWVSVISDLHWDKISPVFHQSPSRWH